MNKVNDNLDYLKESIDNTINDIKMIKYGESIDESKMIMEDLYIRFMRQSGKTLSLYSTIHNYYMESLYNQEMYNELFTYIIFMFGSKKFSKLSTRQKRLLFRRLGFLNREIKDLINMK